MAIGKDYYIDSYIWCPELKRPMHTVLCASCDDAEYCTERREYENSLKRKIRELAFQRARLNQLIFGDITIEGEVE